MAVQLVLCLLTAFLRPGGAELPVPRGLRAPCPPAPALLLPRGLTHRSREHPSPGGMEMVQGWDGTEREPPLSPAAHREHRKAHPRRTRGTSHEHRAQPAAMGMDAQHTPARCCPALPCARASCSGHSAPRAALWDTLGPGAVLLCAALCRRRCRQGLGLHLEKG